MRQKIVYGVVVSDLNVNWQQGGTTDEWTQRGVYGGGGWGGWLWRWEEERSDDAKLHVVIVVLVELLELPNSRMGKWEYSCPGLSCLLLFGAP